MLLELHELDEAIEEVGLAVRDDDGDVKAVLGVL